MTKKILLSLLFIVAFILILSASDKVSAFEFEANSTTYNTNGLELYKYNLVYWFSNGEIDIISSDKPITAKEKIYDNFYNISVNEANLKIYYMMLSKGYWQNSPAASSLAASIKSSQIIYLDYDIYNLDNDLVFINTVEPDIFFNFRFGTLDYSINISSTHITLREYISVFRANNYLFIWTSQERPSYKYSSYKHFLCTTKPTNTYLYDLKTDSVIRDSDLTYYYASGAEISFDKSQLVYSNFVLYDENMQVIFGPTGDYLGEEDMKRYCFREYFSRWTNF